MCFLTPRTSIQSPPSASTSRTRFSGDISLRCWSMTIPSSVFASVTLPSSGAISPVSSLSKVVLPAPLAPTSPIRSPRVMRSEKSVMIGRSRIAFGNTLGVDHDLRLHIVARQPELGRAGRSEHRRPRRAHFLELGQPSLVAAAARGDPALEPVKFELELGVELVGGALFLGIDRFGPRIEPAEPDLGPPHRAAVEPQAGLGQPREEGAVVADRDERALEASEPFLEPVDRAKVEMVGRLVEQQHVGLDAQRADDRRAAPLAAARAGDVAVRSIPICPAIAAA